MGGITQLSDLGFATYRNHYSGVPSIVSGVPIIQCIQRFLYSIYQVLLYIVDGVPIAYGHWRFPTITLLTTIYSIYGSFYIGHIWRHYILQSGQLYSIQQSGQLYSISGVPILWVSSQFLYYILSGQLLYQCRSSITIFGTSTMGIAFSSTIVFQQLYNRQSGVLFYLYIVSNLFQYGVFQWVYLATSIF